MSTSTFPFSAVVGHDDLRLALLLNAVHPGVGGVLVRGEKGTAKSTAVRALAAVLPDVAVEPDCRFSCDPAVPDPRCPDGPHAAPGPVVVYGDTSDRADAEVRRRDGLALLDVDEHGFDEVDRKLLLTIIDKFAGGPVGVNALAASISEEPDAIEDMYEPYLIQIGFLDRTPRGRVATVRAYEFFGLEAPGRDGRLW